LVGLFARGLNCSTEFKGGALLQFPDRSGSSVAQLQTIMAKYGAGDAQVEILSGTQSCGATQSEQCVNVKTKSLTSLGTQADQLRAELAAKAGISPNQINETDIGPSWGTTISRKAIVGLVIFLVLVTIYITLRFEWKMAIGAIAALVHDLIIHAGIYALVGR